MKVLYALICEHAETGDDSRVDVRGIFHQLYAPGFPAQQERLTLAVALEWEKGEEGRRSFRIDLLDPAGGPALTISGHTDVGAPDGATGPPQTRLVMPLENVVFAGEGSYSFVIRVDGTTTPLAPLHLIQALDAEG